MTGEPIGLKEACRLFPLHPRYSTVLRWTTHGVFVGNERIRLAAEMVGRRLVTTAEEVRAFIDATTGARLGRGRTAPRLSIARRRELDAVLGR